MPLPRTPSLQPIDGARIPLFDRLIDHDPSARKDIRPLRVYERQDLVKSVGRDLHRLLNSRRGSFGSSGFFEATVIGYGIPDFSALSAVSVTDRRLFAETLRAAIVNFEPRLLDVTVQLTADPDQQDLLSGSVSGKLRIDRMLEPVTFPILLHGEGGEIEVLALPEEPGNGSGSDREDG